MIIQKASFFTLLFSCISLILNAQWMSSERSSMPEAVSNHAMTAIELDGKEFVYVFSGIDSTKLYSGIHKRSFKYDVSNDRWHRIADLPSGNGRIAAAASVVKEKIYIIGGYEVFDNGDERSFKEVHIFDPKTDSFLADGMRLYLPIDDHVQCVWRDSLIYVISGWSNTQNVEKVQVYNPAENSWREASSVPANNNYMVFGASGQIINDTIYYAGGARMGTNFPPTNYFRKGIINPSNPLQITWNGWQNQHARGYRMAAGILEDKPVWFGGSLQTYNFNGIAYNGSGGVDALDRIVVYDPAFDTFELRNELPIPLMDFRGLGQLDENRFLVCGGMTLDQKTSKRTFILEYDSFNSVNGHGNVLDIQVFPVPGKSYVNIQSSISMNRIQVFDIHGSLITNKLLEHVDSYTLSIPDGMFILFIVLSDGRIVNKKIIGL